ncbi:MAG: S-methyl-5-thioribose-1-phosphate isomerase [Gemmatimonadales bacterium]
MRVGGRWFRSVWIEPGDTRVSIIDQTVLPDRFEVARLGTLEEAADSIQRMRVRGAVAIGVAAAYGVALAMRDDPSDAELERAVTVLGATRPTAVNLRTALDRLRSGLAPIAPAERAEAAWAEASAMAEGEVADCRRIAEAGLPILREHIERKGGAPVQVLTHCNAGWLASVDWGTALAPIYLAHDAGLPVHVWVDETRPRNQGLLTAWELRQHGVAHTVVVDNAGGYLMRRGQVDLCLVGTDRTTRSGAVANKIGTYLKALAAHDNGVPFYVAAPSTSIDWTMDDGDAIPIEGRSPDELGFDPEIPVENPAFDVTPARLVTKLITERGVADASEAGLAALFPEAR